MLTFYVNRDAWDKLPKNYQEAFEAAAQVANHDMIMKYDAKNPPAFSRLLEGGTKLRQFSDDIMDAAKRQSFAIMEEEAATDATYGRVYSSWKRVHEEYYRWFATSERSYSIYAVSAI